MHDTPEPAAHDRGISLATFQSRLIAACVIPLVLLAAWLGFDSVRDRQADTDVEAENLARNFATAVDQRLAARIAGLKLLADSPALSQPGREAEAYGQAQAYRQHFDSHVVLADTSLKMLLNTRVPLGTPLPMLPVPPGRSAVAGVLANREPAVGDIVQGPVAGKLLIAVAVPVLRGEDLTSVLLTTLESDQFRARMEQLALPAGWMIAMRDSTGDTIARYPAGNGTGDDAYRYTAKTSQAPWSVEVAIPGGAYRAPSISAATLVGFAVILATVLGVLGGKFASRRLARAVSSLAREPLSGTPPTAIREIDAVQRMLAESARARQDAVAGQQASEARFEATFDQAAVGIALVGPDGRWLRVNQRLCDIVVYTEAELLKLTFQDITVAEDLDADLDQVRRMLTREIDNYAMEKRYIRKDGRIVWVLLTVALTWKPDGTPDYFISVVEDIDARKRTETELHMWAEVFAKSQLALAIADASSNRFIAVSPQFAAERGFAAADLVGKPVASVYAADRLQEMKERIAMVDANGHGIFETEHLCRDGRRFPVLMDITVIKDAAGTPRTRVAYALDITERKHAEAQLREQADHLRDLSDRLMRAQEDERRMLAHELHDEIGQQLAALKLNLKSIPRAALPASAGERLDDCIAISDTAIEQLRDRALSLRPSILDELGLCAAVRWYCRLQAKRAGIAIYLREEALPAEPADPARITAYRIVQEAVNNAIRHAGPTRIDVFVGGIDDAVEISVDDDGRGIDATNGERESGLGLLGMRERAGWLGGTFEIHSAPGKGTRIAARLPLETIS